MKLKYLVEIYESKEDEILGNLPKLCVEIQYFDDWDKVR